MEFTGRRLYLLFTPDQCRRDPWWSLAQALDAGVHIVQYRAPTPDAQGLRRCMDLCAEREVPVIVNDYVDLAAAFGTAGAHIGQEDLSVPEARAILSPSQHLGVSTHNLLQAERAVAEGADHIGLGPCFPTQTKGYDEGLRREVIATVVRAVAVPVFAIGGITPENARELEGAGLDRFAVSGAILRDVEPGRVVRRFLDIWS